jgi:serine/threonine-protein kinase HipA
VTERDIGARLRSLSSGQPTPWTRPGESWSLAGAQSKFALRRLPDGSWAEASGGQPTSHIVKHGIPSLEDQALNEHLCLATARALGLDAAESRHAEFDHTSAIVLTRFDRHPDGQGGLTRIHQEDLCQASGTPPRRKYESSGGPGAVGLLKLLLGSGRNQDRQPNADAFVAQVAFNYLVGAPDSHAKNSSILLVGDAVRLAPLYDTASAIPYDPALDGRFGQFAFSISGERRFGRVTDRHWARLATDAGLEPDRVLGVVADLAGRLPDTFSDTARRHGAEHLATAMLDGIARLCRQPR